MRTAPRLEAALTAMTTLLTLTTLPAVDSTRDTSIDLLLQDGFPDSDLRAHSYSDTAFESSVDSAYYTDERHAQSGTGGFAVVDIAEDDRLLFAAYLGGRVQQLDEGLRFLSREDNDPNARSGPEIPGTLASISAGFVSKLRIDADDSLTWRLGVHDSSDHLFGDPESVSVEAEVFHRHDLDNGDSVFWGLYWYQRQDPPSPALGYVWRPGPDWEIVLGWPFARVHWQLAEDWSLDASLAPVWRQVDVRLSWQTRSWLALGTRVSWHTWDARPRDREDPDDVLGLRSWRAGLFAEAGPEHVVLRAEAGYAFGRQLRMDEGAGVWNTGGHEDVIDLSGSAYVNVSLDLSL